MHSDVKKALKAMAVSQVAYVALSAISLWFPNLYLNDLLVLITFIVVVFLVIVFIPGQIEKGRTRPVKVFLVLIVVLPVLIQHPILREMLFFFDYLQSLILPLSFATTAVVSVGIAVAATQNKSFLERKYMEYVVYFLMGLIAITIVVAYDYLLGPAPILEWILGFACGWLAPAIGRMIIKTNPLGDIWTENVITVKGYSMQSTRGEKVRTRWLMIWGTLTVTMWAAPIVAIFASDD
jgi:hypothetical protein